jgi:hypothetical protein
LESACCGCSRTIGAGFTSVGPLIHFSAGKSASFGFPQYSTVSPNYKIPANSLQSLHFRPSHSNDTSQ